VGNQTGGSGWGVIVADVYAPSTTSPTLAISESPIIRFNASLMEIIALLLTGHGAAASGNTITATGSATGVYVADVFANVTNNTIQIGAGTGIMLYTPLFDAATVTGNTLSGTGSFGNYIGSLPAAGGYQMYGNIITGFATPMVIDPH